MKKKIHTALVSALLILLLVFGCNGAPNKKPAAGKKDDSDLVVAAYGDTRPKWWPFKKQLKHYHIAKEISRARPDIVLFTGDMVLFNLQDVPRVKITKEWDPYYGVIEKYFATKDSKKKPPFYPTLGNHELLTWKMVSSVLDPELMRSVLEPKTLLEIANGTKTLKEIVSVFFGNLGGIKLEKLSASRKDALKSVVTKNLNELYHRFNTELPVDRRVDISWNVMKKRIFPKHPYLKDLVDEDKKASWYCFDKAAGKHTVRFVCLNSNARGSKEQLDWFKQTCEGFDKGPIVVFAHHPIHSVGEHAGEKFTKDFRKEYQEPISKYATLYICGHEHNYQRFSAADPKDGPLDGPVFIVTGGGGAPIQDNKKSETEKGRFYPEGWDYRLKQQFNYVRLTFKESESGLKIYVKALGWKGREKPEGKPKVIEFFNINWAAAPEN